MQPAIPARSRELCAQQPPRSLCSTPHANIDLIQFDLLVRPARRSGEPQDDRVPHGAAPLAAAVAACFNGPAQGRLNASPPAPPQIYKGPEGESTQWDDIQRRLGNLPAKEAVWKPEKFAPEQSEAKDSAWLDRRDERELEGLEDDGALQDDRALEKYRCGVGMSLEGERASGASVHSALGRLA